MANGNENGNGNHESKKAGAEAGKQAENGSAKAEKAEPEESCQELKERLLRLAAEFDNYKKRVAQETAQAKEMGMAELAKALLTIIDEFELMLIAATESSDKGLCKGVELVYANLMETLKKAGLKEINAKDRFDPYMHEIVMAKESNSKEGMIIETVKKGYMFKDKVLRPSSVIVSKGRAERQDSNEDDI
jgi:molecular chaperone GrpE